VDDGPGPSSEDVKESESENKERRTNECNRFLKSNLHPFALLHLFSGIDFFTASQTASAPGASALALASGRRGSVRAPKRDLQARLARILA
jgi:hypothetical protein